MSFCDGSLQFEKVFWYAGLALCLMIMTHVFIWRVFKIRKQMLFLFGIFLLPPVIGILLFWGRDDAILASFLALCLGAVYVQSFPAVQAKSPSLVLLRLIAKSKPRGGLTREEIYSYLGTASLLEDRMNDLKNDGLITRDGQTIQLKTSGRLLAAFFYYFRRVLGLPRGEG